jgi:hypothetical protein
MVSSSMLMYLYVCVFTWIKKKTTNFFRLSLFFFLYFPRGSFYEILYIILSFKKLSRVRGKMMNKKIQKMVFLVACSFNNGGQIETF